MDRRRLPPSSYRGHRVMLSLSAAGWTPADGHRGFESRRPLRLSACMWCGEYITLQWIKHGRQRLRSYTGARSGPDCECSPTGEHDPRLREADS